MENPLTPQNRRVIVPVLKIFKVAKRLRVSEICNRYAKAFGNNFSPRRYGFHGTATLVNKLDIFERLQGEEVAISQEKLLKLTVLPLTGADNFEEKFAEYNGFPFDVLCKYFEVRTLKEMMKLDFPHLQPGMPIPGPIEPVAQTIVHPPGKNLTDDQSPSASSVVSERAYGKALLKEPEQLVLNPTPISPSIPHPGCGTHMPTLPLQPPMIRQSSFSLVNPTKHVVGLSPSLATASPADLVSTRQALHDPEPRANREHCLPHFPNSHMPFADESYLPSIPSARPDMEVHQPPRQLTAPTFSAKDSSEMVKTKVDGYMQNFIFLFSSQEKHFPASRVIEEAKAKLNIAYKACRVRISLRDIPSCSKFETQYHRISEFIRAFCWNCPFCSLFDLQRSILYIENVSSFADLQMGPILKHPLIKDFFKPSEALKEVPAITAYDIHFAVNKFIDANPKRKNQKLQPEEFMEFFARCQGVASPDELCVRITSFALLFSSIFRFKTSQRQIRERLQATTEEKIKEAAEFEIRKMKRMLSRTTEEKHLLEKDPVILLEEVFAHVIPLCPSHFRSRVTMFFDIVTCNKLLRKLFQLAIYEGAYGMKSIAKREEHQLGMQAMFSTKQGAEAMNYKSTGEILHILLPCLKRLPFPVNLGSLSTIEKEVMAIFGVEKFSSLGQGPFLSFIAKQPRAIKVLGSEMIGTTTDNVHSRTKRTRALFFVKQLKDTTDKEKVSKLIIRQFDVDSVQELGCGSVDKLLSDASQVSQPVLRPAISFAFPLLLGKSEQDLPQLRGGVLGPQTRQDALKCLQQAPLLEDLACWSHWDSAFAPSLGSLADFLLSLPDDQRLYALEVKPTVLLKVCPTSTTQDFIRAVQALNPIDTAGHLVSITVSAGSVHQIPTQLLAKQVHSKMEEMLAASRNKEECGDSPAHFVFHCIVRIPVSMCAVLAKEVFIDPLRKVTSSSGVDGMLGYCHNFPSYRHHLQALGMRMGIKAWSDDYREMLKEGGDLARRTAPPGGIAGRFPTVVRNPAADQANQLSHDDKKSKNSIETSVEMDEDATTLSVTVDTDISEEPLVTTAPSLSPEALAERESACKRTIERIRQEEFGVGLKLNQRQKKIAEKQREREGRGLARLSKELYSKDTHFVLELVQNADDNSYPPHFHSDPNSIPSLKFVLTSKCITVLNNEVGFSEKNVQAICDVGRSTKNPCRAGYIGQKGIGFKSVFRVTDTPEIHSNGFHIQFDTTSGPIGYILPHWKSTSFNGETICDEELKRWMTRIVLPLKAESSLSLNLVDKFKDIQPSLLLFLNRLRCIIVEDRDSQEIRKMRRSDKKNGITEIAHGDIIDRWLVVRKQMDQASQYKSGVEATELALAFPLPENLKSPPSSRELSTQQVFAFLPLRSYGFRFIVQGDFDLPSSREDVNTDSDWNQWLREEIPSLFLEAAAKMKVLTEVTDIEAVALYMQFVPLEGEVHDFFQPVAGQILQLLRGQQCLPTDPSTKETDDIAFQLISNSFCSVGYQESEVQWKQPSRLLRVPNELIRAHIPQVLLSSTLDLHYLHRDLHSAIGPDLCSQLGIGVVTVDHLIAVAEVVLKSYEEVKDKTWSPDDLDEDDSFLDMDTNLSSWSVLVQWVAQWLACVHIVMEETRSTSTNTLQDLRRLKIIPLTNQSLVSLDSGAIFFPPVTANEEFQGLFSPIYDELRIIDAGLLKSEDKLIPVRVMKLLSLKLGVKELQSADVIRLHILPSFQTPNKVTKPKLQISYLAYIKHNIDQGIVPEPEMVAALKDTVLLHTNNGSKNPSTDIVHFSSEYQSKWDLCKMFPELTAGMKWTIVSPKYLQAPTSSSKSSKADPSSWRQFLLDLGVQPAIAIERIDQFIDPASKVDCSWTSLSEWRRSPDGKYVVRDYASKEFDDVVRSVARLQPDLKLRRMKALAELIDSSWSSGQEYKKYMRASFWDGSNSTELGEVNSSFSIALSTKPWLPAVNHDGLPYQANFALVPEYLHKGCDLFQCSEANRRLLYCHVPYIGANLKDYSFIKHLQLREDISAEELLELLHKWSATSFEEGHFTTSVEHMRNVYLFMGRKSEEEEQDYRTTSIKDTLQNEKLIFVPFVSKTRRQQDEAHQGKFYSVHDVCWNDNSTILYNRLKAGEPIPDHLPKILSYFYHHISTVSGVKHVFLYFGVSQSLKTKSLIDLLEYNASFSPSVEPNEAQNFRTIIEQVIKPNEDFSEQECEAESYLKHTSRTVTFAHEQLKTMKVFPSKSKKWVSLERLFIDDAPEVSKYFDPSKIDFLFWPNKSGRESAKELPHHLSQPFHIPLLSKSFSRELAPGQTRPYRPLQMGMHYMVPVIQRFIHDNFSQLHESLQNRQGIGEYLKRLQFFSVIELNCIYSIQLHGKDIRSEPVSLRGYSLDDDSDRPVMYAVVNEKGKITDKHSLVRVLCSIFFREVTVTEEASTFLNILVMEEVQSENDQILFMESHHLEQPLPTEIPKWDVPLPDTPKHQPHVSKIAVEQHQQDEIEEEVVRDGAVDDTGEAMMKAWPPNSVVRASVEVKMEPCGRKVGGATKHLSQPPKEKDDDIITLDFVQKVKGEEGMRDDESKMAASLTTPRTKSLSNKSSAFPSTQGLESQSSSTPVSSDDHHKQLQPTQTAGTHGQIDGATQAKIGNKVTEERPERRQVRNEGEETAHRREHVVTSQHSHGPQKPAKVLNFTNVTPVDLSSLLQTVELDMEHAPIPDDKESSSRMEVGRWGEQFVYSYLKNRRALPNQAKISSIIWINEAGETGYPYDIKVEVGSKQTMYVEVKTTSTKDKAMIPTSWNELHFAQEKGELYLLFRVYNAGKSASNVQVKWLQNLFRHIETHPVKLFITL